MIFYNQLDNRKELQDRCMNMEVCYAPNIVIMGSFRVDSILANAFSTHFLLLALLQMFQFLQNKCKINMHMHFLQFRDCRAFEFLQNDLESESAFIFNTCPTYRSNNIKAATILRQQRCYNSNKNTIFSTPNKSIFYQYNTSTNATYTFGKLTQWM